MKKIRITSQNLIAAAVLLAVLLTSCLWLSDRLSSPELHQTSIEALDKRKGTVMELTAATAASSVAISAVPGDATTPIADQVAELSSYLLLVTGIILLEKFLLTMTIKVAFTWLIPIACILGILYQFIPRTALKQLAIRLGAFALAICMIIPVSLKVGDLFEETFHLQQAVENAQQATEDVQKDTEEGEAESGTGGITGWFSQIGEQLTSSVTDAVERAKDALNSFIDAVAVLLISNCAIPVLIMFLFLWLAKAIASLPLSGEEEKPAPGPGPRID